MFHFIMLCRTMANTDINIQHQAVQVTVQATSNPAIVFKYICTFFPFLTSNIKINCLLKLAPHMLYASKLVIEVVQDHNGQHHHWLVV